MKKSALTTILATLGLAVLAAGPIGTDATTATNTYTYTHRGQPAYLEQIDIRCSGVTTATVTIVNNSAFTNTVFAGTNTVLRYGPVDPVWRIDKGGVLTVTFSSALTTNTVWPQFYQK